MNTSHQHCQDSPRDLKNSGQRTDSNWQPTLQPANSHCNDDGRDQSLYNV